MTGRPAPETTSYTQKTPAQSAKTSARALQEGIPSMSQTTRPLPEVDEQTVASWPIGEKRTMARNAYRLMLSAGAALEELLSDTPTETLTAPYAELPLADQLAHASRALVELREMKGRADVAWSINVPPREYATDCVELHGSVWGWHLPKGVTTREEAQAWAELVGATAVEDIRPREVEVRGSYLDVPVDLSLYLPASEVAGGAR